MLSENNEQIDLSQIIMATQCSDNLVEVVNGVDVESTSLSSDCTEKEQKYEYRPFYGNILKEKVNDAGEIRKNPFLDSNKYDKNKLHSCIRSQDELTQYYLDCVEWLPDDGSVY